MELENTRWELLEQQHELQNLRARIIRLREMNMTLYRENRRLAREKSILWRAKELFNAALNRIRKVFEEPIEPVADDVV
jgi:hypothetical protein